MRELLAGRQVVVAEDAATGAAAALGALILDVVTSTPPHEKLVVSLFSLRGDLKLMIVGPPGTELPCDERAPIPPAWSSTSIDAGECRLLEVTVPAPRERRTSTLVA